MELWKRNVYIDLNGERQNLGTKQITSHVCSVEHQYLQIMVESCCLIDFSFVYICVYVFVVNFLYFFYFIIFIFL